MPVQQYPHILIRDKKERHLFSAKSGRGRDIKSTQNPQVHGEKLSIAYQDAIARLAQRYETMGVDGSPVDKGATVELQFRDGATVDIGSLENQTSKIELLNTRFGLKKEPESAVLYIPPQAVKNNIIGRQIDDYKDPAKKKTHGPANFKKYDAVENINAATLDKLWLDHSPLPDDQNQKQDWEIWLRKSNYDSLKEKADEMDGVRISSHKLNFPEREICSIHCSFSQLDQLQLLTNALSGFRYLPTLPGFFDALPPTEQGDWAQDLISRISFDPSTRTSVCVLDTGIFQNHRLLADFIVTNGVDSVDPDWDKEDHHGHGTQMAGLSLFGDLTPLLESSDTITLKHGLESVKVFPPDGDSKDERVRKGEHVGYITSQAIARAEVNNQDINRVFCLSWSMEHEPGQEGQAVVEGKPTSLSAKIDQLAFGVEASNEWGIEDDQKRLLIISAGNIRDSYPPQQYPDINDVSEVEDPAQAWNALTVGAITDKTFTNDPDYNGWGLVAGLYDLSPKSRTSVLWGETYWPTKPDIVMEGGNYLARPTQDYIEPHPDASVLTTDKKRLFGFVHDTSPANAAASRLTAMTMAEYPEYWPETVRGLLVHSAEWVGEMNKDFSKLSKAQKIAHLRRYGYGVPQEQALLNSLSNRPCIVIQDTLRPFKTSESEKTNQPVFNDLNHYVLPWPVEKLNLIHDQQVQLRLTLSYFIEPNPSERPPETKYSYASHGLRFKLNRPNESKRDFLNRVGREVQVEEDNIDIFDNLSDSVSITDNTDKWRLGPQSRDRGSLISDTWLGTAGELATQNLVAIAPQGGWWKHRKKFPVRENPRYEEQIRYSLIISLVTEEDIDLHTPIASQVGVSIEV